MYKYEVTARSFFCGQAVASANKIISKFNFAYGWMNGTSDFSKLTGRVACLNLTDKPPPVTIQLPITINL